MQALRVGARAASSAVRVAEEQFPSYLLNVPATEVTTLSNGVRVATEVRTHGCRLFAAMRRVCKQQLRGAHRYHSRSVRWRSSVSLAAEYEAVAADARSGSS